MGRYCGLCVCPQVLRRFRTELCFGLSGAVGADDGVAGANGDNGSVLTSLSTHCRHFRRVGWSGDAITCFSPSRRSIGSRVPCRKREADWSFDFGDGLNIAMSVPWRVVTAEGIAHGDEDNGQWFGLPEPVNGWREHLDRGVLGDSRGAESGGLEQAVQGCRLSGIEVRLDRCRHLSRRPDRSQGSERSNRPHTLARGRHLSRKLNRRQNHHLSCFSRTART